MPLYEYECTQCKRHTEKIQKFSDAEITECPYCGGLLGRVISAPAISFKGGGWYADGYGNAKPSVAKIEGQADSERSSGSTSEAGAPATDNAPKAASSESSSPAAPAPATPAASNSEKS